jgi:hypothetical protein
MDRLSVEERARSTQAHPGVDTRGPGTRLGTCFRLRPRDCIVVPRIRSDRKSFAHSHRPLFLDASHHCRDNGGRGEERDGLLRRCTRFVCKIVSGRPAHLEKRCTACRFSGPDVSAMPAQETKARPERQAWQLCALPERPRFCGGMIRAQFDECASGEVVLLHERLFLSKVNPRIIQQLTHNRIDHGVASSRSQRPIQLVHRVKQFLVLLVEKRDLHAVHFSPTKRTGGNRHFLPPKLILVRRSAKYHLGM